MSENPDATQGDLGFRKLSSDDILSEQVNGSNGHAKHAIPNVARLTPACAACNDTWWIATKPAGTGLAPTLTPCVCQNAERGQVNRLQVYAALGDLSNRTFKSLEQRGRRGKVDPDSFQSAVEVAKAFADDPSDWLVLSGPIGSGKTHIAAAITNHITNAGRPAKYVSAMQLADIVRRLDDWNESEDSEEAWDVIAHSHVLVLDDFGSFDSNSKVDAKLEQLLTIRAMMPLPTVIVLSRPSEQLPDRFKLRFSDSQLCTHAEILSDTDAEARDDRIPKPMLERMTFDTFDPNGRPDANSNQQASLSMALDAAKRFAESPNGWLYLHGDVGVGKTHLAIAIAGHASSTGYRPTFWRLPDLLDRLRHSFSNRSEGSFYELFESVKNSELLILDDFGAPAMTDWTIEKLYQLVCHRHDRLLPTVTTSPYLIWNPESEEVSDESQESGYRNPHEKLLWASIKSRLRDSSIVTERLMSAPDYRDRGA